MIHVLPLEDLFYGQRDRLIGPDVFVVMIAFDTVLVFFFFGIGHLHWMILPLDNHCTFLTNHCYCHQR